MKQVKALMFVACVLTCIATSALVSSCNNIKPPDQVAEEVQGGNEVLYGEQMSRSGHWPTVMQHFRCNEYYDEQDKKYWAFTDGIDRARCRCCGSKENLNVHHIVPFHNNPDLECDVDNLVTLCRDHHFHVGHHDNWKNSNPNVCKDCDAMRSKLNPNKR